MKFTLHDYQADAVDDVLKSLERAKQIYEIEGKEVSVSLSATTGAGKTVMAAAVIEALFYGNETFDFEADPGAVVIWFSDDPNLNEQTRFRLMQASEKLTHADLVTIQPPFAKPRLDPGKVYFLNTGKLTKSSLLTRGHVDTDDVIPELSASAQPDLQGWTIWETIANTIADDELTLYLILDEAHRGFNTKSSRDKSTIVSKLVNGHAGYPPIPIVWGISATIERFKEAMAEAETSKDRRALPPVTVDGFRVQQSGLVKDTVVLDIPAEAGNFDTVLVRRAARKLREFSERWEKYAKAQGSADVVRPLLLLQAPNTPDTDQLGLALNEIFSELPELRQNAVRHVFGEHTIQQFGTWEVEWIEPQRVQEMTTVRVLVAKDAISTGWDCPRAEVMVSFRPAKDHTHITQLLGRMVRNPLARRVPGDEKLNSVECILPLFDRTTAGNVVKFLTGKIDGVPDGSNRKTIYEECLLEPNPTIADAVWKAWDEMLTETVPQRGAAPVKRLVALAHALSQDGIKPGALKEAEREMHLVLDAARYRYPDLLEKAVNEVWTVRGQTIAGTSTSKQLVYSDFIERADDRAIQSGFSDAKKVFGSDIAQSYVNHIVNDDDDDSLREAYVTTSALAIVMDVRKQIDREADELATKWFAQTRVARLSLPDERQQEYHAIQALAVNPQEDRLQRPRTRIEDYLMESKNGQLSRAPMVDRHLMSDADGMFPIGALNEWEREVVVKELSRKNSVGWYRNPPRQAVDSLGVSYRDEAGNWRSMHPDFVFFNDINGAVLPSIVDPHGHHLEDSLVKLQGLAEFAKKYGDNFHRIEAISKVDGVMRILDLKVPIVRDAILASDKSPMELYVSDIGTEYDL
jgi:hypothetical protein